MRHIEDINITESLNKQKLICSDAWIDKFDRITFYFIFIAFIGILSFTMFHIKYEYTFDPLIIHIILSLVIIFSIYIIYRKATELNLIRIESHLDSKLKLKLLIDLADTKKYTIFHKSENILVLNKFNDYSSKIKKSTIFIFTDDFILFTIIQDKGMLNVPILMSQFFLRYKLKKIINKQ